MKKLLRFAAAAACLALCAYFLLPLAAGIFHIGMVYPTALLLLPAFCLLFPRSVVRLFRSRWRKVATVCAAAIGTTVVCILTVCLLMGVTADNAPAEDEEITVLVLGCQVIGERPSLMLRNRIDAAYDYLVSHPEAMCVATGGLGDGTNISEGACIRKELMARGIDSSRIFVEDRSVNTAENMAFSAAIIEENGLPTTVAVASDNFHQLRASIFAKRNGLETRSLGCASPWFLGPGYWAREVLALGAAYIRGY